MSMWELVATIAAGAGQLAIVLLAFMPPRGHKRGIPHGGGEVR
ncbi:MULTISPECIES: hypothetical protein [Streptomyces]